MALSPTIITASLNLAAVGSFTGPTWPMLSAALGQAVYTWFTTPGNVILTGVTTGEPGPAGVVSGVLTVAPLPSILAGFMQLNGASGPTALPLAGVIANGLATAINTSAQYVGTSTVVALGTDISAVTTALPSSLMLLLKASFIAQVPGSGPSADIVLPGLAQGIAAMVQTMTGTGAVTGVPVSATPAVGVSTSGVI